MPADPALAEASLPTRYRLAPSRKAVSLERRRLAAALSRAISEQAFQLAWQPRIGLRTGRRTGAEAAVRWPRAKRGGIPGGAVLPLAEECGRIAEIGAWAMTHACLDAQGWEGGTAAVPVAARQLMAGGLEDQVRAALTRSGLPAERLSLELAESALLAADTQAVFTLSALRDLGVGVAVDDFGGEVGSLALLRRLPLSAVKLDRTLVRGLPGELEDAAMVEAIIAAAHALGIATIAKGIETEAQRACLAALGCDEGQGYLFVRPDEDPAAVALTDMS